MKKKLRVLVIAPYYRWFVKELVDAQSRYVDEIHFTYHYNPFVEISNYIPLGGFFNHLRIYTKQRAIDLKDKPNNVFMYSVKHVYFIPDGTNKGLGDALTKKIKTMIQQKGIEFDIIHAHFAYPQGYIATKLAQAFNAPVVITGHGHDVYDMPFRDNTWRKIMTNTFTNADHVITVSNKNKDILVTKLKINKNKISVIPNGFDPAKFRPLSRDTARTLLNLPTDKKVIINIGNLYESKGHEYLIKAMKSVTKLVRDVLCIIIGDGPKKDELQGLITKLGLESHVILAGHKAHHEIPIWLNAADLFVLSSINEGNPTVMFEALGVGLPFVGTAVGGVPEIITSTDYGLLVNPKDTNDLAEKILMALSKDWDRSKIIKYASNFTWDNIAKQTIQVYNRVLNQG